MGVKGTLLGFLCILCQYTRKFFCEVAVPLLESFRSLLDKNENTAQILLVLGALVLLLLLGGIALLVQVRSLNRRLAALTVGGEGNLEQILASHLETVGHTVRRMETLEQAVGVLQAQMPGCLQRTGLVRYDAFEDVGGEQSFSAALLDGNGNGLVLTSVYGRTDVRVYAKAVQDGRASHALSEDEQRALRASLTK